MLRYWPLFCLALVHAVVDCYAMVLEPLWPRLKADFQLTSEGIFWLLTIGQFAINFSQPVFGYLRDRYSLPAVLWLGPLVGVISLSLVGIADNFLLLCLLTGCGMAGVGAFHPQAAVTAGTLMPEHRTRGLALFMFGGTLGLGLGPMLGGFLVEQRGLSGLALLALPGAFLVLVLSGVSPRGKPAAVSTPRHSGGTLSEMISGQGKLLFLLLFVCSLRVVPNVGMTKALAFTLSNQGLETSQIGTIQSVFLVSGSLGMLLMATFFRPGWERASMILCPLAAVPLLLGLSASNLSTFPLVLLLTLSGALMYGTTPAMVSYSHHVFPRGAGLASALTMGVSWGCGGILVAMLIGWFDQLDRLEWLYPAFIPCQLLSALGACLLPSVATINARHAEAIIVSTADAENPATAGY